MINGVFDVDEAIATIDRQVVEGTWHYARLHDERHLRPAPTTAELGVFFNAMRTCVAEHGTPGPVAVLANHRINYTMVLMYLCLAADLPTLSVFRDVHDADRWLARLGFE